jgi:hypothetical protein
MVIDMKKIFLILLCLIATTVVAAPPGHYGPYDPGAVRSNLTNITSGSALGVANGGTGKTTAAEARAALGGASLNGSSTVAFNALTLNGVSHLDVFSACATTSQSIPVGDVLTKVGFPIATDTAGYFSVFDPAGWQVSSTTVRLPKTGYYQVSLNAYVFGGDSGKQIEFLLMSAGYSNLAAKVPVGITAAQSFNIMSCILKITEANSEVFVFARNNSTSAPVSVGYSNTRLSIKYLGGL